MPPLTPPPRPHVLCLGLGLALLVGLAACGGGGGGGGDTPAPAPVPVPAPPPPAPAGPVTVTAQAVRLDSPWGMASLPDGSWLVTQRRGSLVRVAANLGSSQPVSGVPAVDGNGQGGLLDVALDPDFATTSHVYLSYA